LILDGELTGALLIDKPPGPTSHDIVAVARRVLKTRRVGHTGTLDPLATGLLVLLIGPATRLSRFLVSDEKEYIADVRLGVATPTYDAASLPAVRVPLSAVRSAVPDIRYPTDAEIETVVDRFRGSFLQTPPPYSAKKVAGVASYERARKNQTVNLQPVRVTVKELQVLGAADSGQRMAESGQWTADGEHRSLVRLRVTASAGFYVRSLAHDLGQALACGAHLEGLRRVRAGRFRIEDAVRLDELQAHPAPAARVIPANVLLSDFPAVTLTPEGLRRAANGNPLSPGHLEKTGDRLPSHATAPAGLFRVLDGHGEVLAVAEGQPDGLLHPVVVLR
jgi:tRNA pseudouridine55 synthase